MDKKLKLKPLYEFSHGGITGNVILDTRREKENGYYPIRYRVIFQRKAHYYKSGYDASEKEWDGLSVARGDDAREKRKLIKSGFDIIEGHVKEIKDVFSFESLDRRLRRGKMELVSSAFDARITELNAAGQVGTASIYNSAKLLLLEHRLNLKFADVTPKFLEGFEQFATSTRKTTIRYATLSMYLRCLRTLYNTAIREGVVTPVSYPFQKSQNDGRYKIKAGSGTKTALTVDQLAKFMQYEIPAPFKGMQRSKDIFMLSFHLGGINIKDLLLLKWENIANNELTFMRSKTARTAGEPKPIQIPLTADTMALINRHCNTDRSPKARIFPFLPADASPAEVRHRTLTVVRNINRDLYKIADELEISGLSSMVARHSIATVMKNSSVPVAFIQEMLGHTNISTTMNYLKSFEPEQRRETFDKIGAVLKQAVSNNISENNKDKTE